MGGFFSQLGALYQVHHIWAYNDLQHRKTERERMWEDPGWDDCVAATGKNNVPKNWTFSELIAGDFIISPFHTIGLFLYPLETLDNQRFSDVLRGYIKRPVT